MMLKKEETDVSLLKNTRIFHFGSLSMTDEGIEATTKMAVETAKEAGALLSFDPNLRPPLWKSLDIAKEKIQEEFHTPLIFATMGKDVFYIRTAKCMGKCL